MLELASLQTHMRNWTGFQDGFEMGGKGNFVFTGGCRSLSSWVVRGCQPLCNSC